jgi:hypothetical protein
MLDFDEPSQVAKVLLRWKGGRRTDWLRSSVYGDVPAKVCQVVDVLDVLRQS